MLVDHTQQVSPQTSLDQWLQVMNRIAAVTDVQRRRAYFDSTLKGLVPQPRRRRVVRRLMILTLKLDALKAWSIEDVPPRFALHSYRWPWSDNGAKDSASGLLIVAHQQHTIETKFNRIIRDTVNSSPSAFLNPSHTGSSTQ